MWIENTHQVTRGVEGKLEQVGAQAVVTEGPVQLERAGVRAETYTQQGGSRENMHISESGGNRKCKGPETGIFLPYSGSRKRGQVGQKGSQGVGCDPAKRG